MGGGLSATCVLHLVVYAVMVDERTDLTTLEKLSIFLSLSRTQPASEVFYVGITIVMHT